MRDLELDIKPRWLRWPDKQSTPSRLSSFVVIVHSTPMCRRRYVTRAYTICGHQITTEESAPCENRFCKFSVAHPDSCGPPECTRTCWQYRQYPEKYLLTKNESCPECPQGIEP